MKVLTDSLGMNDMNDEFELRNRIVAADPAKEAPVLNESVVAKAVGSRQRRLFSFRGARLALGSASFAAAALAVAITVPSFMTPQPLFTLATESNGQSALSESSDMSIDREMDAMIWPGWIEYEYVTGDAISDATGSGEVFQGQVLTDPQSLLERLAPIFGIVGTVSQDQWSTPEYPSYSVTAGNASLATYFSGTGSWYYSNWSDNQGFSCEGIGVEDSEDVFSDCVEIKPTPELIPSAAEITSELVALSGELGLEIRTEDLSVYRDDWGAYASWPYLANGISTGLQNYANWGPDGQLSYFASHDFELISRGVYDTVSARTAVERISEGRWYGNPPESYYQDRVYATEDIARSTEDSTGAPVAPDEPVAVEEPAPGEAIDPETEPKPDTDEPAVERPEPVEPQQPEVITLTITSAETTMLSVWDSNGGYWLVPGYVLFNDSGWFDAVISLPEGLIELPDPMQIMPFGEPEDAVIQEMVD